MLEIKRLAQMLTEAGIPFERVDEVGTMLIIYRLKYPSKTNCVCSVIQGPGICGDYLLEIMGLASPEKEDGVEGYLTAEEVFERIKNHWDEKIGG